MKRIEIYREPLSLEEAEQIKDSNERLFAQECISRGHHVFPKIPVNGSLIDFYVVNRKKQFNQGKLVEVTIHEENILHQRNVIINKKGRKVLRPSKNGWRKKRQINAMRDSDVPYTVMWRQELENIKRNKKKRE